MEGRKNSVDCKRSRQRKAQNNSGRQEAWNLFIWILPQTFSKSNTITLHHNTTTSQQSTTGYTHNSHNRDGETQAKLREHRNGGERWEGKYQSTEDCNKTNHKTTNTLHIHHQSPHNFQIDAFKNTSWKTNRIYCDVPLKQWMQRSGVWWLRYDCLGWLYCAIRNRGGHSTYSQLCSLLTCQVTLPICDEFWSMQ